MRRVRTMAVVFGLTLALSLVAGSAFAALCVWVNPDRDIKNFFPGAKSYTTEVKKYTKAQQQAIEKRIGGRLDPDENEFKFYRVKKDGAIVGTVADEAMLDELRRRLAAMKVKVIRPEIVGPDA